VCVCVCARARALGAAASALGVQLVGGGGAGQASGGVSQRPQVPAASMLPLCCLNAASMLPL
jgi:hypothetical protein